MTRWVEIGRIDDIPRLGARVVRTAMGHIAVFRTARDEIFALADRCPHKGGPLSEGIVHGAHVTCPLHNMVVELASGRAVAPDKGCVESFAISIEGEIIRLGFDESGHRASAR
ncbi:MAG: nitrite reductase small subunit NirD [Stellaceae bacterium]